MGDVNKGPLPQRVKVVVVGGGVSGLAAAGCLQRGGVSDVVVLEADNRPGGRLHTLSVAPEVLGTSTSQAAPGLELGAQWIHGSNGNPLYSLATSCGISLVEEGDYCEDGGDRAFVTQEGERVEWSFVKPFLDAFDVAYDKANSRSRRRDGSLCTSVTDVYRDEFNTCAETLVQDERQRKVAEALYQWRLRHEQVDNAISLSDCSLSAWDQYEECGSDYRVPGCFSQLLHYMLQQISPGCLRCKTPVRNIKWTAEHVETPEDNDGISGRPPAVTVTTATGETYHADYVIVTCSLGYLKRHQKSLFDPPLTVSHKTAIQNMKFGTVNKMYLAFSDPWWPEGLSEIKFLWVEDDTFKQKSDTIKTPWYHEIEGFDVLPDHPNVLEGWVGGPAAEEMEGLADDTVRDVCLRLLASFMGVSGVPPPVWFRRTMWHTSPYILGSYSSVPTEGRAEDSDTLAVPLPSPEVPVLQLAGEATCRPFISTLHGAYDSGRRAAATIARHVAATAQEVGGTGDSVL